MPNFRIEIREPEQFATKLEAMLDKYHDVVMAATNDHVNTMMAMASARDKFQLARDRGGFGKPIRIRDDSTAIYEDFGDTLQAIARTYQEIPPLKQHLLQPLVDETRALIKDEIDRGDPQGAIKFIQAKDSIRELFINPRQSG